MSMNLTIKMEFATRPADVEHVYLETFTDAMGEFTCANGKEIIGPMTPADDGSYLYRLAWRATRAAEVAL